MISYLEIILYLAITTLVVVVILSFFWEKRTMYRVTATDLDSGLETRTYTTDDVGQARFILGEWCKVLRNCDIVFQEERGNNVTRLCRVSLSDK